jgi:hypothetical protein
MTTNGQPQKKVSQADLFKAGRWMEANWEMLKQERFGFNVIAERLKTEIGVELSAPTVKKVCIYIEKDPREIIGRVRNTTIQKKDFKYPSRQTRLLSRYMIMLLDEVRHLQKELGIDVGKSAIDRDALILIRNGMAKDQLPPDDVPPQ